LPPDYHLGTDPEGKYLVVKRSTEEVFSVEVTEEELPMLVVDLWREYIQEAPAPAVARVATIMTALDALLTWEGELQGGPRNKQDDDSEDGCNYGCTLWGKEKKPFLGALGHDDDPINAILKARRSLVDSLKGLETTEHDPEDEEGEDLDDEQIADRLEDDE